MRYVSLFSGIEAASVAARYKALGNSMAVPVMGWIGKRIERNANWLNQSETKGASDERTVHAR